MHIAIDVILRNAGISIQGTLEVVSFYYMVCLVFLPMGYVELKHQHIRVDLIAQRLPQSLQVGLYVLSSLIGLLFFRHAGVANPIGCNSGDAVCPDSDGQLHLLYLASTMGFTFGLPGALLCGLFPICYWR